MQLPCSEELNIEYRGRLFDNTSECYKFFWFKAIVAKVTEGKQEIQNIMQRNKFAMKVLWLKEIEPISIVELQERYPELKIPISFHFLDKKPDVLKWLDENENYTGYQIENDFSDIGKDDICVL